MPPGSDIAQAAEVRLYAVLATVNRALVRAGTAEELLAACCRAAVEQGGYRLAWVGKLESGSLAVRPVAVAGEPSGYVQQLRVTADEGPYGRGPTGTAIRERRTVLCELLQRDQRTEPWHELAREAGLAASVALPLHDGAGGWGALNVYAAHRDAFGAPEIALLEQVAEDLSYGLRHLGAMAATRAAVDELRFVTDHVPVSIAHCGTDQRYRFVNRRYAELFGQQPADLVGRHLEEVMGPAVYREAGPRIAAVLAGSPTTFDMVLQTATAGERVVRIRYAPEVAPDGAVVGFVAAIVDNTARHRAETALHDSDTRLRLAIEASEIGLWDWDLQANTVRYSVEWKKQIGYAEDEISDSFEEWRTRVHPADLDRAVASVQTAVQTVSPRHEVEFRFRHKDGSYRWILARGEVLGDAAGQPVRMLGCHIDITDRKAVEAALAQSEARLRSIFDQAQVGIFIICSDNRYLAANPFGLSLLGYSLGELLTLGVADVLAPNEVERLADEPPRMMAGEPHLAEWEHRRKDGSRFYAEVAARRLDDTSYLAIVRDLTARRQEEERLRESEAIFRTAFAEAPVAMALTSPEGRLWQVNRVFCELLGYGADELLGRDIGSLTHPADRSLSASVSERLLRGELATSDFEKRFLTQDGRVVWTAVRRALERDATGQPQFFVTHMVDLTARKLAEQRVREMHDDLRRHADQQERLIHELLQARESLRDLALEMAMSEERERRRIALQVHDGIGQTLAVTQLRLAQLAGAVEASPQAAALADARQLLATATDELRGLTARLSPVALYELGLETALRRLADETAERFGLQLAVETDPRSARLDEALQVLCYQFARELLHNVVKHARAAQVTLRLSASQGNVLLAVEDDGVGPVADVLAGQLGQRGGLGLFSIRERAEHVGGRFTVARAASGGMLATVTLPQRGDGDGEGEEA